MNNIYACHNRRVKFNLKDIFCEKLDDGKLFANWVADELYVPKGKCILYVHLGYKSVYEEETVLEFEKGILNNERNYKNFIAKEAKWRENPNTYLEFVSKNINWQNIPDLNGRYITVKVGIQPDENGKIANLIPEYTYMIEGNAVTNNLDDYFIKEAIRIANLVPEWDVIFQRGKILGQGFMVVFSDEARKGRSY